MTKVFYALFLIVLFSSCNDNGTAEFRKAKSDGTEYKIIPKKGGKLVTKGNVLRMDIVVRYKDSLLYSTYETGMPRFAPYDTSNFPALYKEVFKTIHVGDSIVFKLSTDTIMKRGQGAPFMRKGQYIYENYIITNAYLTQQEADKELAAARVKATEISKVKAAEQLKKDDKTLQDYLAKNNIKAEKAPEGTYVEMIQPGTGNKIDTNVVVTANYTGRTLDGKIFDSNTDPAKRKSGPFEVNLTSDPTLARYAIAGWKDGLQLLSKGAKARFYIPSPLAYGPNSPKADIPANSILIFDIEVVDVFSREEMAAKQKSRLDSITKLKKNLLQPKKDSLLHLKK